VEALHIPFVVTLHTVLPHFADQQGRIIQELCRRASAVTVFTATARRLIVEQELAPARVLHVVAHGAPSELYADADKDEARQRLGLPPDVPVMSTFGLLSEGKGIELALQAMALLRDEHPDLHYVIAGRTHPEVLKRDGERYRQCLQELSRDLELSDRVIFLDRFLDLDELAALLAVSDVVCTPYRGEAQSVSGVLTFSLAAGCAVASTPYRYARDVLADGAGLLADFGDDEALAGAIHNLLDGPTGTRARAAARQASASMAWPTVGAALRSVLLGAISVPAAAPPSRPEPHRVRPMSSPPGVGHLRMLCDDTAIFQHAHFNVPRVEDGYCLDDVARMLPIAAHLAAGGDAHWRMTVGRLLAFVRAASLGATHGQLHNFMSWERQWLDTPYVGDHVGRAIWGLGELIAGRDTFAGEAEQLMAELARSASPAWPVRTVAYSALGLVAAAAVDPARDEDLARLVPALQTWTPLEDAVWQWSERRLTYDNARLPEALLRVGHRLHDDRLVEQGAAQLRWLDRLCRVGEHYRFPGHRGLSEVDQLNWSGDEQPLEAAAMADAQRAWFELSADAAAADAVERAFSWFLGNNRLGEPLVDLAEGACFDGLGSSDVNRNRGAESTIAFHRCLLTRTAVQSQRFASPARDVRAEIGSGQVSSIAGRGNDQS
jgi:hypothetical protein